MLETSRQSRTLRELRALCAEVGTNDPEAFASLVEIRAIFDVMIREAAGTLRRDRGHSWADLARPLGISRQAAQQRYGESWEDRTSHVPPQAV